MSLTTELSARAGGQCELCAATGAGVPFSVGPESAETIATSVLLCSTCQSQLDGSEPLTTDHWRSLTDTMWSQVPAVQVMVWRTLRRLRHEGWAAEALDMLYLDDDVPNQVSRTRNPISREASYTGTAMARCSQRETP